MKFGDDVFGTLLARRVKKLKVQKRRGLIHSQGSALDFIRYLCDDP
jgi:hypothetical protein